MKRTKIISLSGVLIAIVAVFICVRFVQVQRANVISAELVSLYDEEYLQLTMIFTEIDETMDPKTIIDYLNTDDAQSQLSELHRIASEFDRVSKSKEDRGIVGMLKYYVELVRMIADEEIEDESTYKLVHGMIMHARLVSLDRIYERSIN